jgi:hypothetical protein
MWVVGMMFIMGLSMMLNCGFEGMMLKRGFVGMMLKHGFVCVWLWFQNFLLFRIATQIS